MITLAVFAVLLAITVPSYNDMTLGSKLRAQANELVSGAVLARSEAIKRNSVVSMCVSADGASCVAGGWEQGWLVFHDADNDAVLDVGETVLLRHGAAPSGFRISGTVANLAFQATGVGSTAAVLTVCRALPSAGSQERVVSVTATGRASVERTNAAVCP
ncbi:GspH/FimT family pseudopilin [Pseudomonas lalucatii]|nr:GspH/FimT family pseudopilin [Pseudomonas lalucatii]